MGAASHTESSRAEEEELFSPRIWGWLFPLLLARSAVTHVSTGLGPAHSPCFLSLAGNRRSDFLPSTGGWGWRLWAAFLLVQKKRKNCSPCRQMADCFLAVPLHCLFSYCPDTHTYTESSFPLGKINKCKRLVGVLLLLFWGCFFFYFFKAVQISSL